MVDHDETSLLCFAQPCIISTAVEDGAKHNNQKREEVVMLSEAEVAIIRAEIERLEKALQECADGGIRDRIKKWIEDEKKKLFAGGEHL